jgi:hypothetical protein
MPRASAQTERSSLRSAAWSGRFVHSQGSHGEILGYSRRSPETPGPCAI